MANEAVFKHPTKASKPATRTEETREDSSEDEENSGGESTSDTESEDDVSRQLSVLKAVFLASKEAPEVSLSQSQAPSLEEEVAKQKMLVQYLSDSVKCSKIIDRRLVGPGASLMICVHDSLHLGSLKIYWVQYLQTMTRKNNPRFQQTRKDYFFNAERNTFKIAFRIIILSFLIDEWVFFSVYRSQCQHFGIPSDDLNIPHCWIYT